MVTDFQSCFGADSRPQVEMEPAQSYNLKMCFLRPYMGTAKVSHKI